MTRKVDITLTQQDTGEWLVTCAQFPELLTQGENLVDALEEAADAMSATLGGLSADEIDQRLSPTVAPFW